MVPPIPGVRENLGDFVLTNREVLELPEVPKNFAIIGGGVIGLEMAAYYCVAGAHVTVIEMLDHIAGPTDREISTMLQKEYAKKGVDFKLNTKVVAVEPGKVVCEADGKTSRSARRQGASVHRPPRQHQGYRPGDHRRGD